MVAHRSAHGPWVAGLLAICLSAPGMAAGLGNERAYIATLRQRGFADWAIDYLRLRQSSKQVSRDLEEILDLELAACFRVQAEAATSLALVERKLDDADAHLKKFLESHADHAAASEARSTMAEVALQRGRLAIRVAGSTLDAKIKAEKLAIARAMLDKAEQGLSSARDAQAEKLAAAAEESAEPTRKKPATRKSGNVDRRSQSTGDREQLAASWADFEFKRAQALYLSAQTYEDKSATGRKEKLIAAGKAFDAVYQRYRTSDFGLYAHMWHGKSEGELGDLQAALDIFDEVLVNAPEGSGKGRSAEFDSLFAEVERYRLQVLIKQKKVKQYGSDAAAWLKKYRGPKSAAGYCGIALDYAKWLLEVDDEAATIDRRRRIGEALRLLDEIAKLQGEHQSDAILLARRHRKAAAANATEFTTFDEAAAVGESLAAAGDHAAAVAAYARALELTTNQSDTARLDAVRYRLALAQFAVGKQGEAAATAATILAGGGKSASGAAAAGLVASIAYAKYAKTPSAETLIRLRSAVERVVLQWPESNEADDARLQLGQALAHARDFPSAIAALEKVDAKSPRRPTALLLAARSAWLQHRIDTQRAAPTKPKIDWSSKAESLGRGTLELLEKASQQDRSTSDWIQCRVLLAEIRESQNDAAGAVALLEPVVQSLASNAAARLDPVSLVALGAAIRAKMATNRLGDCERVWKLAAERGGDRKDINAWLMQIAAAMIAHVTRTGAEVESIKAPLTPLLATLAARKDAVDAATVGDWYFAIGDDANARLLYQRALAADRDGGSDTQRVRLRLAKMLRKDGKHADALALVEAVATAYPRWLEPQLERAATLMAMGLAGDSSRLGEAVAAYTKLRVQLARMPKRPPEYYDVVYNAAYSLKALGAKTGDDAKRTQAAQLLKSTLTLDPRLDGPATKKKFEALLAEIGGDPRR